MLGGKKAIVLSLLERSLSGLEKHCRCCSQRGGVRASIYCCSRYRCLGGVVVLDSVVATKLLEGALNRASRNLENVEVRLQNGESSFSGQSDL
jgi:hypothetical protein